MVHIAWVCGSVTLGLYTLAPTDKNRRERGARAKQRAEELERERLAFIGFYRDNLYLVRQANNEFTSYLEDASGYFNHGKLDTWKASHTICLGQFPLKNMRGLG